MTEVQPSESHFPQEINFDPQIIAQVLRAKAERPSAKMVRELAEIGVDLTKENVWEIFLFDSLKKVEGYLTLYPDKKEATFHTRVHAMVEPVIGQVVGEIGGRPVVDVKMAKAPKITQDLGLGTLRITNINEIVVIPAFGHVWFESPVARLDVYHDCQHSYIPKSNQVE